MNNFIHMVKIFSSISIHMFIFNMQIRYRSHKLSLLFHEFDSYYYIYYF